MFAIDILKKAFHGPAAAPRRNPVRTLLAVEILESREVFSLSPVSPYAGRPFTAIVELQATFPDHKTYFGSGVMVDRFHVLTAGHVIYSYADGGFASRVVATPDLYGNTAPFGVAYMTYERTYPTFMNYNRTHPGRTAPGDYDIALITLDRTIGDRTGWMSYGYDNNNAHFAPGAILNTAGYPATGGYNGRYMEFSYGGIYGLSPDGLAIQYRQTSITAFAGQSGSPVWRYTPANGQSVVYGVHVGGNGNAASINFATRITQGIFNDLQNWRAADYLPRAAFGANQSAQSFVLIGSPFHSGNAQAAMVSLTAPVMGPQMFAIVNAVGVANHGPSVSEPTVRVSPAKAPTAQRPLLIRIRDDGVDQRSERGAVLTVHSDDMNPTTDVFSDELEDVAF
jgi:V8-like Glu-specific endopeptidase